MVKVTRLNGKELVVNCELIEFIESTPDTVITISTGKKIIVRETVDEVLSEIVKYKRKIHGIDVEHMKLRKEV